MTLVFNNRLFCDNYYGLFVCVFFSAGKECIVYDVIVSDHFYDIVEVGELFGDIDGLSSSAVII